MRNAKVDQYFCFSIPLNVASLCIIWDGKCWIAFDTSNWFKAWNSPVRIFRIDRQYVIQLEWAKHTKEDQEDNVFGLYLAWLLCDYWSLVRTSLIVLKLIISYRTCLVITSHKFELHFVQSKHAASYIMDWMRPWLINKELSSFLLSIFLFSHIFIFNIKGTIRQTAM